MKKFVEESFSEKYSWKKDFGIKIPEKSFLKKSSRKNIFRKFFSKSQKTFYGKMFFGIKNLKKRFVGKNSRKKVLSGKEFQKKKFGAKKIPIFFKKTNFSKKVFQKIFFIFGKIILNKSFFWKNYEIQQLRYNRINIGMTYFILLTQVNNLRVEWPFHSWENLFHSGQMYY